MIRLACNTPNQYDATAYYRADVPFSAMASQGILSINHDPAFNARRAMLTDVAFFQRPSQQLELDAIKIFKEFGVPVIADYDDLLFEVPTDNPAFSGYNSESVKATIVEIMRTVDVIFTSTKELKRSLQLPKHTLNKNVYVVPNALDDRCLLKGPMASPPKATNRTALWRGSATHMRDVMEYAPEIGAVAEKYSDLAFTFVGWNPWFLTDRMRPTQAIVTEKLSVGEFMKMVHATAPSIGYIPLHDSQFNRCKSNIGWLEMTWAGAACLVPDWEEWRSPGAITYKNHEDFRKALDLMAKMDSSQLQRYNRMAWDYIQENLLVSKVNHIRQEVIEALVQGRALPAGGEPYKSDEVMELQ